MLSGHLAVFNKNISTLNSQVVMGEKGKRDGGKGKDELNGNAVYPTAGGAGGVIQITVPEGQIAAETCR